MEISQISHICSSYSSQNEINRPLDDNQLNYAKNRTTTNIMIITKIMKSSVLYCKRAISKTKRFLQRASCFSRELFWSPSYIYALFPRLTFHSDIAGRHACPPRPANATHLDTCTDQHHIEFSRFIFRFCTAVFRAYYVGIVMVIIHDLR